MKLLFSLLISVCTFFSQANGQDQQKNSKAAYFDFWIGNWDLRWEAPDGTEEYGINKIERVLSDKVIKENFEATGGKLNGYIGKSWSVYDARTGEWKQTWVDNRGGYLDFTGGKDGDKRYFHREAMGPDGESIRQRMIFYAITENSFIWDWEMSKDEGKSWQLQWRIHYEKAGQKTAN